MEEILKTIMLKIMSIDGLVTVILGISGNAIYQFLWTKYRTLKLTTLPINAKIIRVLGLIFAYIAPSITIISLIFKTNEGVDLKIVLLFVLNCAILIFNILIERINTSYRMIRDLSEISSDKLSEVDSTFTNVYKYIEKLKKDNDLK